MKMRSVAPMRIAKIGYIVMSVLLCITGGLFIAVPDLSVSGIGVFVGSAMAVFGVIKLIGYFSKDLYRLAFQYDLEFGILLIILGLVVLFRPDNFMNFICIVIGMVILLDGLFKIRIAMDSREFGIKSWWFVLMMAIFTGLVGAALVFDSARGAKILTVLLGISLLSEGILNLYTVISTVRIIRHQRPDTIEAEFYEEKGVWK